MPDTETHWLTHETQAASAPAAQVIGWTLVPAPRETGTMLVGPEEFGAQAIVPPGVLARSPEGSAEAYTRAGWRRLRWSSQNGATLIDVRRPTSHETMSLLEVALTVFNYAPAARQWLEREVVGQLRSLRILIEHADLPGDDLRARQALYEELLLDATEVFTEKWLSTNLPWLSEGIAPELVAGFVLEPGLM